MKSGKDFVAVLVTAPDLRVARKLAQAALERAWWPARTWFPKLESTTGGGKIESSSEVLLLLKTTRSRLTDLKRAFSQHILRNR
jgi:uncharacterized protein involved in tolerance to divalent cations